MIKINFFFVLFLFSLNSFSSERISIKFTFLDNPKIKWLYVKNEQGLDSTLSKNGKFEFFIATPKKIRSITFFSKDKTFSYPLFVEDKDVNIYGNFSNPKELNVTGSKTQLIFLNYLSIVEPLRGEILKKVKMGDLLSVDSLKTVILNTDKKFVVEHPESVISVSLPFFAFKNKTMSANEAIKYLSITKSFQPVESEKFIKLITESTVLKDGDSAPAFELKNVVSGELVKLRNLKKTHIVLAFWATWCKPCLSEIPALNSIQKNNPEVQVISISLDKSKHDVLRAIEKYNIKYTVLSDFVGENSQVALKYGVGPLPTTFIIDDKGKISESKPSSLIYDLKKLQQPKN